MSSSHNGLNSLWPTGRNPCESSSQLYLCSRSSLPHLQDTDCHAKLSRISGDRKVSVKFARKQQPSVLVKRRNLKSLSSRKLVHLKRRANYSVRRYLSLKKTVKCESFRDTSGIMNASLPNPVLEKKAFFADMKPGLKHDVVQSYAKPLKELYSIRRNQTKGLFLQDEEVFSSETPSNGGRGINFAKNDTKGVNVLPFRVMNSPAEIYEIDDESNVDRPMKKPNKAAFVELPGMHNTKNKKLTISSGQCFKTSEPNDRRCVDVSVQHSAGDIVREASVDERDSFPTESHRTTGFVAEEDPPATGLRLDHEIRISDADGRPLRLYNSRGSPLTDKEGYLTKDEDGHLPVMLDSGGIPLCCSSGGPIYTDDGKLWLTQQHLFDVTHKSRRCHKLSGDGTGQLTSLSEDRNHMKDAILSKILDSTPCTLDHINSDGNKFSFFHRPTNATYEISVNWEDSRYNRIETGHFSLSDFDHMYTGTNLTEMIQNRGFEVWSLENSSPNARPTGPSVRKNSRSARPTGQRTFQRPHRDFMERNGLWHHQATYGSCCHCRKNTRCCS